VESFPQVLIVVALLAGPTIGWLLYRGMRLRMPSRWLADYEPEREVGRGTSIDELLGSDFVWTCPACTFLNRATFDECYRCHAPKPRPDDTYETPIDPAPVPVMAMGSRTASVAGVVAIPDRLSAAAERVAANEVTTGGAPRQARRAVKAPVPDVAAAGRPPLVAVPGSSAPATPKVAVRRARASGSQKRDGSLRLPPRSVPPSSADVEVRCPLLGLRTDRLTHFLMAHPEHRCHAEEHPMDIDRGHQEAFCLTPEFRSCAVYRARPDAGDRPSHDSVRPADSPDPRSGLGDGAILGRLLRRT
jgi:hypothetical protein